jgi:DNA-binding transcriptional MerR regulator
VDLALRTLADAGLALDAAEEALAAGEAGVAEERLAEVDDQLTAVRERWPELSPAARAVAGPAGKQVRERRDALARRLPRRRALSEAAPTAPDPDEDRPPDEG